MANRLRCWIIDHLGTRLAWSDVHHVEVLGEDVMPEGIALADAITQLRDELLAARSEGAHEEIQLPIESLTLELKVVATRTADGKAGFRVPIVNAEVGGSVGRGHENTQTVTVVFGSPLDSEGRPAKIAHAIKSLPG